MSTLDELYKAIVDGDAEKASQVAAKVEDPLKAFDVSTKALKEIGDKFEKEEVFLPTVVMAADAVKAAMKFITGKIPKEARKSLGKIVIGTVAGDVHEIGKTIVGVMLGAAGFEVYDIGRDLPAKAFVDKAKEVDANVVGASALMTVTMPEQKRIAEMLKKSGLREKVKYVVGGAPTSEKWAELIGADARGEDAIEALHKIKALLGIE